MYGSPALDLHYFFVTSLSPEVRENHLDELLQCYYSKLVEIAKQFNLPSDIVPSMDDFLVDFNNMAFYGK